MIEQIVEISVRCAINRSINQLVEIECETNVLEYWSALMGRCDADCRETIGGYYDQWDQTCKTCDLENRELECSMECDIIRKDMQKELCTDCLEARADELGNAPFKKCPACKITQPCKMENINQYISVGEDNTYCVDSNDSTYIAKEFVKERKLGDNQDVFTTVKSAVEIVVKQECIVNFLAEQEVSLKTMGRIRDVSQEISGELSLTCESNAELDKILKEIESIEDKIASSGKDESGDEESKIVWWEWALLVIGSLVTFYLFSSHYWFSGFLCAAVTILFALRMFEVFDVMGLL